MNWRPEKSHIYEPQTQPLVRTIMYGTCPPMTRCTYSSSEAVSGDVLILDALHSVLRAVRHLGKTAHSGPRVPFVDFATVDWRRVGVCASGITSGAGSCTTPTMWCTRETLPYPIRSFYNSTCLRRCKVPEPGHFRLCATPTSLSPRVFTADLREGDHGIISKSCPQARRRGDEPADGSLETQTIWNLVE